VSNEAAIIHLKLQLDHDRDPFSRLRDLDFYLSGAGDWVYLQCDAIGPFPHPFSLSSPPHGEISLDISMAGPFTIKLGRAVKEHKENHIPLPMTLRGPFPSGFAALETAHAEHVVLVGAGIGLTPICSLARHLMAEHRRVKVSDSPDRHQVRLKSLSVFIALPTKRHYEALYPHFEAIAEEARQCEAEDLLRHFVIFITRSKPSSAIAWSLDDLDVILPELHISKNKLASSEAWDVTEGSFDMIRLQNTLLEVLASCERDKEIVPCTACGPPIFVDTLEASCIQANATAHAQGLTSSLRVLADIFG
jgi:NAD(P)H-flavin reductase